MKYHPLADVFPLIEGAEFDALVADVAKQGLLEAIVTLDGDILDGRNRYRACVAAGVEPHFEVFEGADPVAFVVSKNVARRHLDESQRAIAARKISSLKQGARLDLQHSASLHEVSQAKAAEILNVSERSVKTAGKVIDHGAPELVRAVEAGRVSVSAAADVATLPKVEQTEIVAKGEKEILEAAKRIRLQKAEVRRAEIQAIAAKEVHIPAGKFSTIVIDPPWPMEKIERDVREHQVAFDYPIMSEEQLAAFPLADIAADDCHLFCWTTHKFLPMSLRLLDAWGFRYVLAMVWHKPGGFQPFGLPQYNCEFAIYARRGTPTFADTKAFNACFQAPRREHSRKPDEFYDVIRRVTTGPRIDVFSREARDGFEQYGNETSKFEAAE